jgi:hypothetical protein
MLDILKHNIKMQYKHCTPPKEQRQVDSTNTVHSWDAQFLHYEALCKITWSHDH